MLIEIKYFSMKASLRLVQVTRQESMVTICFVTFITLCQEHIVND